jgi:hypothetical protein|nr:MAG TPA: hypothetical protein [Caudoviricetes sp.]
MSELITTLHPQDDNSVNLYPNVKLENIIDGTAEDAGKFVKVNEEGKFIVDTVNIPEPQQVNNSTVTIKQGGVDKGSFTLNQAEDATIELDAGGGSNMYATSSAISKGVPAHKEAAAPIQVGDTISQLYFNTQPDIGDYLADVVDWGNGNKIINMDGTLIYPLLTGVGDENVAGFRELKTNDCISGLKIKADYEPGDGKVDPELNNWLANALVFNTSVDLFTASRLNGDRNLSVSLIAAKSGAEYTLDIQNEEIQNAGGSSTSTTRIYSSKNGFTSTSSWDSSKHAYELAGNKELFITEINETESANWNGVFFGAVSNLGEIILSVIKIADSSYTPGGMYMLTSNGLSVISSNYALLNSLYYVSAPFPGPDSSVIKSGWHVTADQVVTLSGPKKVTSVNSAVSKIASSEVNWVSVPEVFGSIYQDDILGTDEVKINDILVDTIGTLGKVKEFSEESFKNQHPANPFAVGDEIPANSYIYIDTSITPDLSKIDWSGFVSYGGSGLSPLVPLGYFQLWNFTQSMAVIAFGIKLNKPIYILMIGEDILYFQVDPSDVDKLAGISLTEDLGGDMNTWIFHSEQVTHEGSIFKVPLGNSEAVTLTDISDQDVWGAFISKDGRWVEDTPISRTNVRCETLRRLPTNYENLDGIPILKLDYIIGETEGYEFIPGNYENKYIQDPTGIIYFCDGQKLYQLTGSGFTVRVTGQNGLRTFNTSASDNSYSTDIGLETTNLGQYSQTEGDQVFGRRSGKYGWINLPSQSSGVTDVTGSGAVTVTQNGDGREVSLKEQFNDYFTSNDCQVYTKRSSGQFGWTSMGQGSVPNDSILEGTGIKIDAPYAYSHRISLSQDVQDSLAKANSALQESALSGYATTSQVDAKYTKPAAGIPETDLSVDIQSALTKANSSISGVKVNGTQVTVTDGVADIGTVITAHQSLDGKQDKLNDAQLTAVNSGITSGKVSTYDGYATSIQTLTTNLSSSDAKITQNTADITELKTKTVKKADMKGLELPDLPSADGNYALTCTITGGVPTFAWTIAG